MARLLYAITCVETEELSLERDWYLSPARSFYAAIAKAADSSRALPGQKVAKEIEWQTVRLTVEVADMADPDMWKIKHDYYERRHDILADKKQHRPMHNGSQATLGMGSQAWVPVPCECVPVPCATGGSASVATNVKWYRSAGLVEWDVWFPCLSHAVAAGIHAETELRVAFGGVPEDVSHIMMYQLEMAETKFVDLLRRSKVRSRQSMVETWELRFPLTRLRDWTESETDSEVDDEPRTASRVLRHSPFTEGMRLSTCIAKAPTVSIPDRGPSWQPFEYAVGRAKRRRLVEGVAHARSHLACLEQELGELEATLQPVSGP